eukprot:2184101-Pyramimonas_sp.AAC.1
MAGFACVRATHFGTTLTRVVAPSGAPPKVPAGGFACVRATHFGTDPSHGSWPHGELHWRPQWQGSHASEPP